MSISWFHFSCTTFFPRLFTYIQTDRQIDRQLDRKTDRHLSIHRYKQIYIHRDRLTDRQTCNDTYIHTNIYRYRHSDKHAFRWHCNDQTNRQTKRPTIRQWDKQTNKETINQTMRQTDKQRDKLSDNETIKTNTTTDRKRYIHWYILLVILFIPHNYSHWVLLPLSYPSFPSAPLPTVHSFITSIITYIHNIHFYIYT